MKTLCVEGWRFVPHSYAMVNQWQLLSLLKRKDVLLGVRDMPYFRDNWQVTKGLFPTEQEDCLASIPVLNAADVTDVTLRISVPFDFSLSRSGRTVVFLTSEYQVIEECRFRHPFEIERLSKSKSFSVVTPSRWSRKGLDQLGLRQDQIHIIPHGIDPVVFRPAGPERKSLRKRLGLSGFTFANASAMTPNKGIDVLLRAFAAVVEKRPDVQLFLKGTDDLYSSKKYLTKTISNFSTRVQNLICDRILYFGNTVSTRDMAEFYQAVDAYVSPYRAEAFNLPVLEACACGVPVICTSGGPTDDFMNEDFAHFIDSRARTIPADGGNKTGHMLEPTLDHLTQLMFRVLEDDEWRKNASTMGPKHAVKYYNWDSVVDQLLDVTHPRVG